MSLKKEDYFEMGYAVTEEGHVRFRTGEWQKLSNGEQIYIVHWEKAHEPEELIDSTVLVDGHIYKITGVRRDLIALFHMYYGAIGLTLEKTSHESK